MDTNFNLGDNKNNYVTVYKNKLNGRPCKSPARNQKNKFGTNFRISYNKDNDYVSEKQLR